MNKKICWPPSVNNPFSYERLQQKHPANHDKMNDVRFHRQSKMRGSRALCMECNTAIVFNRDPQNTQHSAATRMAHQRTMMNCIKEEQSELARKAAIYALSQEKMHIKEIELDLTSAHERANISVSD